jgi:transposase
MAESIEVPPRLEQLRGGEDWMRTTDEVAAMLRLKALGWGERRIAVALGCNRRTVRRYLAAEGWVGYRRPRRAKALDGLMIGWPSGSGGTADVVRQDLLRAVSSRTVERAVAGLRQALRAEARTTMRFETPPGHQLRTDFGETRVPIGGERVRVYLFVATLGYSRRVFVQALRHDRQSAWFDGIEAAFRHFGGMTREVLFDNARAGRPPRRGDARGQLQRAARRLCALLGFRAAGLCSIPNAHQGKRRARRRLRQRQCDRRSPVHQLGGAGSASRVVDAGDCRPARPRH